MSAERERTQALWLEAADAVRETIARLSEAEREPPLAALKTLYDDLQKLQRRERALARVVRQSGRDLVEDRGFVTRCGEAWIFYLWIQPIWELAAQRLVDRDLFANMARQNWRTWTR